MGNIVSSSLDSLVGYEDCDPSVHNSDFFGDLKLKLTLPPLSRHTTYTLLLFIWVTMTILVWMMRSKMGTRAATVLTFAPLFLFLVGWLRDSTGILMEKLGSNITSVFSKKNKCGVNTDKNDSPDKYWEGKWGFLFGIAPYSGYLLYLVLKYLVLRFRLS